MAFSNGPQCTKSTFMSVQIKKNICINELNRHSSLLAFLVLILATEKYHNYFPSLLFLCCFCDN